MIYEKYFSTEWTDLDRDQAMVRAYALGIASAFDEDHPEEYERLLGQDKRALIEMAYNEGRRKALNLEAGIEAETGDGDDADKRYEVLDRLLVSQGSTRDEEPVADHAQRRLDVPATLERAELLDFSTDQLERLRLPDFLYR